MNIKILKLLTFYIIGVFIYFGYNIMEEKTSFSIPNFVIGLLPISIFLYGYLAIQNSTKLFSNRIYSSKLTSIAKYYIPITNIIWFIYNVLSYLFNLSASEGIGIETICFQFISILISIPFTQLKLLSIEKNEIMINNYSKTKKFKINEITKIKQMFGIFAVIEIINNGIKTRYFIMPRLDEFWYLSSFMETNNIKEIKSKCGISNKRLN